MPQPAREILLTDLDTVEFWAEIQSEHPQILLSVLPHLQERYVRELRRFQRAFDDIARRAENLRARLEGSPETEPEQVVAATAVLVRDARAVNEQFLELLRDLEVIYPETDLAALIRHIVLESERFMEELQAIELTLPPQSQPSPEPTLQGFLRDLAFWARDQREHTATLRAFLPNISPDDRATLARFERDFRSLEQAAHRLREALTLPGQSPEFLATEARRLAMVARNLVLEFIRYQEDLLSRYTDSTSRFLIRHMLKESRRFVEELRTSGFLAFSSV